MDGKRGRRGRISKRGRPGKRYKARRQQVGKSLYDADCWLKVQVRAPIRVFLAPAGGNPGTAYVQMRTDLATSAGAVDWSWIDQNEYIEFHRLYQLCEVRGMKMDCNIGQFASATGKIIQRLSIFGGPAADVPTGAVPNQDRAVGLPIQVQVPMNGNVGSAYLNVNQLLSNAGQQKSTQRNVPYPTESGYALFCIAECIGTWVVGDYLGDATMTWYVRLHQRKYLA